MFVKYAAPHRGRRFLCLGRARFQFLPDGPGHAAGRVQAVSIPARCSRSRNRA